MLRLTIVAILEMPRLKLKIIALPISFFLVVVLSAPALTIHHVHRIEKSAREDLGQTSAGCAVTESPSTYHETHIVTLLSGDSFNSSVRSLVATSLFKLVAAVPAASPTSSIDSLSSTTYDDIRPLTRHSREKCILFCSFLI